MTPQPTTNGNGNYNRIGVYASVAVVLLAIVGAILSVGGIANDVKGNRSYAEGLEKRVGVLETRLAENDRQTYILERDQREIETQFCASDIVRNLMHANDLRQVALLWKKVYGEEYPTDNSFYPQVCNRPISAQ